jgi:hypothetical protein
VVKDESDFGNKFDFRQLAMGLELAAFWLLRGVQSECGSQFWPLGYFEISKFYEVAA